MSLRSKFSLLIFSLITSMSASASWVLNSTESSLYFVTNKAAAIAEVNSFSGLSGSISDNGEARLDISLASVDTAIEIRDERMRDIVFDVAQYPLADISLAVDSRQLESMSAGASMRQPYTAQLRVKGYALTVDAELSVTRLADGGLLINNVTPVVISAHNVGLAEQVEQLREIAGLPSINPNIVVNFSLRFDPV